MKMIEVKHKDFEETAVVPETALKHLKKQGWSEVSASKPKKTAASGDQKES